MTKNFLVIAVIVATIAVAALRAESVKNETPPAWRVALVRLVSITIIALVVGSWIRGR